MAQCSRSAAALARRAGGPALRITKSSRPARADLWSSGRAVLLRRSACRRAGGPAVL